MANTRTAKTETKNEAVAKTEEVVIDKSKNETPKIQKKFAPDEPIECRSVTGGELILVGPKTGLYYSWSDYGDTAWVEYQDLHALQSRKSNFLIKPRFIIENEELVDQWAAMLKPIYGKVVSEDIESIFSFDIISFKNTLSQLPDGVKEAVKTRAVQMINNEELYDIRYVRAMDEILGTDFVNSFLR